MYEEPNMPLFMIERQFAEQLELDEAGLKHVEQANEEAGVDWVFSFLSADKKKTYCLYEAPSAEAIRDAASRAGLPADVVVQVSKVQP